jgi:hypothetical protein
VPVAAELGLRAATLDTPIEPAMGRVGCLGGDGLCSSGFVCFCVGFLDVGVGVGVELDLELDADSALASESDFDLDPVQ